MSSPEHSPIALPPRLEKERQEATNRVLQEEHVDLIMEYVNARVENEVNRRLVEFYEKLVKLMEVVEGMQKAILELRHAKTDNQGFDAELVSLK